MASKSPTKDPEPGDRIEIKRGGYAHWAICTGNDMVIHMRGRTNARIQSGVENVFTISGAMFDKAEVAEEPIWDVVGDDEAYVNNTRDKTWRAYDPQDIVARAKKYVGKTIDYNLMFANCENFTNWCRYGQWHSDQVNNGLKAAGTAAGNAIVAISRFWKNKSKTKYIASKNVNH